MTIEEALIKNIEKAMVYLGSAKIKADDILTHKPDEVKKEDDITGYNKGLKDAWELAKKIKLPEEQGGLSMVKLRLVFGTIAVDEILKNYTPQEALAKLEAYEKEQEEIKVGDVVEYSDGDLYLIITEEDGHFYKFGVINLQTMKLDKITNNNEVFKKTGKHIDISSILEQIGGGE